MIKKSEVLLNLFKESKISSNQLFEIAKNDSDIDVLFEIINNDALFLLKMLKMKFPYCELEVWQQERLAEEFLRIQAFELFITNKIINNFDYFLKNLITPVMKSCKTHSIVREYLKTVILKKIDLDKTIENPLGLLKLCEKFPSKKKINLDFVVYKIFLALPFCLFFLLCVITVLRKVFNE